MIRGDHLDPWRLEPDPAQLSFMLADPALVARRRQAFTQLWVRLAGEDGCSEADLRACAASCGLDDPEKLAAWSPAVWSEMMTTWRALGAAARFRQQVRTMIGVVD